jgi:TatD DNase family protein
MKYFDSHCHIQFEQYDEDREDIIALMLEQEVGGLIVGTDFESSRKAVELVQGREHLYAAIGLHPNAVTKEEFDMSAYRELAQNAKVVAIGECGLDNFRPEDPTLTKAKQREVFESHIQLAIETGKPLMIHARPGKGSQDAYHDAADILQSYKKEHGDALTGDMHFFVGGIEEAKLFLDLDFTMSYTAVLTFTHDYDDVVKYLPLTHILSETDSPYVSPVSRRGQRNTPVSAIDVIEAVSSIRGEEMETVRAQVIQNAERIFSISL